MKQEENIKYWNKKAREATNDNQLTHQDLFQKQLELNFISTHLKSNTDVLEVGCGNGFITEFLCQYVNHVDAFDASDEMIKRASLRLQRKNCNLFVKKLPSPSPEGLKPFYDAIISVRVLINLESRNAQSKAIKWIASKLKPGGIFLLLEGCKEGLNSINDLRTAAGMKPIKTAEYNINIEKSWLEQNAEHHFYISQKDGIGTYDFLTRFFYPLLTGEDKVQYNTDFHEAALKAEKVTPKNTYKFLFSRLLMYKFIKR
ncbi:MAG: hypothetical protein A2Z35_01445 [Actinobacteria bacterium RBG_19FT_COMBO_36_27]|nr:MAG: hypothetical protein A2Z35_01445 [Actinobacteria bacterium RBG_19FT_COMBO_36_27]